MILLLGIFSWALVLYSLRVVVVGEPGYRLIFRAPDRLLHQAGRAMEEFSLDGVDEQVADFVRLLFRLMFLSLAVFIAESVLACYWIYAYPKQLLPWLILGKNSTMVLLGRRQAFQGDGNFLFAIRDMPGWEVLASRLAALISAVCFLFFFLQINGLLG